MVTRPLAGGPRLLIHASPPATSHPTRQEQLSNLVSTASRRSTSDTCVSGASVPSRFVPAAYLDVRVMLADGREEEELPAFITTDEHRVTTQDCAGGGGAAQTLRCSGLRTGVLVQNQSSSAAVPVQF